MTSGFQPTSPFSYIEQVVCCVTLEQNPYQSTPLCDTGTPRRVTLTSQLRRTKDAVIAHQRGCKEPSNHERLY